MNTFGAMKDIVGGDIRWLDQDEREGGEDG